LRYLKICPDCHRVSVEFDANEGRNKCLNVGCGWRYTKGLVYDDSALIPHLKLSDELVSSVPAIEENKNE
jgi:hypothetical protein